MVAVSGSSWIEIADALEVGRRRGYAFGYNGYIYGVGGFTATGGGTIIPDIEFAKVDVSNGSVGAFRTSSVEINQRWGLGMAVSNSFAYVIGGCNIGDSPNDCTSFEPSLQTFQLYNNNSVAAESYSDASNLFSSDRIGGSSTVLNGKIYVAGGCTVSALECGSGSVTSNVSFAPLRS